MRLLLGIVAVFILFLPAVVLAQEQNYQVVKSDRSESFVLPYTASNKDVDSPLVYTFDEPKKPSWILTIQNNVSYVPSNDSRTVVRIQEPAPSEKYIEIVMYDGDSKRYWVAVNTPEAGYARFYDQPNGWSTESPITVTHGENTGLTVTNGKRIVLDRLDLEGFAVGSIAVYGNDSENSVTNNTNAGDIKFEILFGSFNESALYYLPLGVTLGVGGVIAGLLIFKKRKTEE